MSIKTRLLRSLSDARYHMDVQWARHRFRRHAPAPGLLILSLHSIFSDEQEFKRHPAFPHERMTYARLARLLQALRRRGAQFIFPEDILNGPDPERLNILLSFDDGYANNLRVLPILEAEQVPALCFVASDYVRRGLAYWWDVHYRGRMAEDWSFQAIMAEQQQLKKLPLEAILKQLAERYGEASFQPLGDTDRPLSQPELQKFAAHPLIRIGNHTRHHVILPQAAEGLQLAELRGAQEDIFEFTGQRPIAVAYPNGEADAATLRSAESAGLRLGFTAERKRYDVQESLPLMALGRVFPDGIRPPEGQADILLNDRALMWRRFV